MKKIILTCLLLLTLLTISVTADCSWQGIDAWNGDDWQALQQELKPAFLNGIIEGLKFRGTDMGPWEPIAEEIAEYIPAIDRLYEDPENCAIPIVLILDYVNSKFSGMDQGELDLRLKNLQEIARMKAG